VLHHAGLVQSFVAERPVRVTTEQFFAMWNAIETSGAAPDFGVRVGTHTSSDQYHLAFMAALHARTCREALEIVSRYKRLVCPEELLIETGGGELRLHYRWILARSDTPRFLTDATHASTVQLLSRGIGRTVVPKRVELTRTPAHESTLRRHFRCPIVFGATRDLLVFDGSLLREPFQTHNSSLQQLLLPAMDAKLMEHAGDSIEDQVRAIVSRIMNGRRPTIVEVASELQIPTRTLQRRLQAARTSFQQVLDGVRRDAACRLLAGTQLDAGEIAFLLGFEELNSFSRAFQSWEGMTPSRWRARPRSASRVQ
jgi:AraC-like DNA-binding protein